MYEHGWQLNARGAYAKAYRTLQQTLDYALALKHTPGGNRRTRGRPIIVTATDLGRGLEFRCPFCNRFSPLREDWLGAVIDCPQQGCGKPLSVNAFTVPPGRPRGRR
jgi:hypothetical protein